jgi:hypothetical protein
MGQEGNYLGICFELSDSNYLTLVDNRLYNDTGFIVTESIYRDKLSTRKSLEKLKI